MKKILKSFCIAFSIYSKIPVPIFEWKEEDMKYHLIFFPFVGGIIGLILMGWNCLCSRFQIGSLAGALITAAIPILITGGFHVDGYMDTCDALSSYQPAEEKRRILKDPHIGAFSVIMLVVLMLFYIAGLLETKTEYFPVFCCCFSFSRALSGISVILFKKSKNEGMLHTFAANSDRASKTVVGFLTVEALLCAGLAIALQPVAGIVILLTMLVTYLIYYCISMKQFGGISGDLAGFFVTTAEVVAAVSLAVLSYIV